MLLSQSCRSRSKRSWSSALSRLHLFSPCCSFQRRSSDALWLSASRRRCSSRSSVKVQSGSLAGSASPPCASPRTFTCASSSSWPYNKDVSRNDVVFMLYTGSSPYEGVASPSSCSYWWAWMKLTLAAWLHSLIFLVIWNEDQPINWWTQRSSLKGKWNHSGKLTRCWKGGSLAERQRGHPEMTLNVFACCICSLATGWRWCHTLRLSQQLSIVNCLFTLFHSRWEDVGASGRAVTTHRICIHTSGWHIEEWNIPMKTH